MFDFFHSIIVKIVVGISSVALFFSGAATTPPLTPQNATSSAQTEIVVTSSTTAKKAEANTKTDAPKDNKDSLIGSLKKQVADLTQKVNQPSQPKIEAPKTSVVTLPSGAVVEMDANGNVIRTITAAPQQTPTPSYVAPSTPANQVQNPAPQTAPTPIKISIKSSGSSNSYITNGALESFYDITSDSNSEVDLSKMSVKIAGIQKSGYDPVDVLITDETHSMTLYRADLTDHLSPTYGTLGIDATFSQPLVIRSGYPTKIDVQIRGVGLAKQPTITISSIDSGYIVDTGGTVYLFKPSN